MLNTNENIAVEEIAQRVIEVQARWNTDELKRRQALGDCRREQLLALIGFSKVTENTHAELAAA